MLGTQKAQHCKGKPSQIHFITQVEKAKCRTVISCLLAMDTSIQVKSLRKILFVNSNCILGKFQLLQPPFLAFGNCLQRLAALALQMNYCSDNKRYFLLGQADMNFEQRSEIRKIRTPKRQKHHFNGSSKRIWHHETESHFYCVKSQNEILYFSLLWESKSNIACCIQRQTNPFLTI